VTATAPEGSNTSHAADYLVVGAGSAGCVLAVRLAEAGHRVTLIEAGDPATAHPETLAADGFKDAFANDALMWHRMSTPQAGAAGRSTYLGSGRGMGGSGAVNGMVYTRGHRGDFSGWPAGWQWDDLVPAFEAVEARLGIQPRPATPFVERFIAAANAAGFARKDGLNDGDLAEVVGCNAMNYRGDQRRSAYRAFIHDGKLPGLRVLTNTQVRRIVFDEQRRATAVEVWQDGQVQRIGVGRELLLCAGALETPRLLLLSGVGPRAALNALGIDSVVDAPGVGQHLQDHPNVCLFYRARQPVDFAYPQVYAFGAARQTSGAAPDSCYVCYAAPGSLRHSMLRMLPILALPGRLYRVGALRAMLRRLINAAFRLGALQRYVSRIFGIVVILGKPVSRGQIRLVSADPAVPAQIDPAYYASASDREAMLAAVARARQIAAQAPLADAAPMSDGARSAEPARVWRWIAKATMTTFHYAGSCRMGDDADSPVDAQLRVKGLHNVRVADASVMPEIPVSALNAPSMMIGYRAADLILGEHTA
jgi:choline dehydrogenase